MGIIGRIIGKKVAEKIKEKKREQEKEETGEKEEEERKRKEKLAQVRATLLRATMESLREQAHQAIKKMEKRLAETQDKEEKRVAQELLDWYKKFDDPYYYIALPAAAEILERKLYKNPREAAKLLIQTQYQVLREAYKNIPGIHEATDDEHRKHGGRAIHPYWGWEGTRKTLELLYYATKNNEFLKLKDMVVKIMDELEARSSEITRNPELIREIANRYSRIYLGEEVIPPEEEELTEGLKLLAQALAERASPAITRAALALHHAEKGTITPEEAARYIEITTAPHTPQGTGFYNIFHHLISEYERQAETGEEPRPPHEIIEEDIRAYTGEEPRTLLEKAARHDPQALSRLVLYKIARAIPRGQQPPSKTAQALLNLIKHLEHSTTTGGYQHILHDLRAEAATLAKALNTQKEFDPFYKNTIMTPEKIEETADKVIQEMTRNIEAGREEDKQLLQKTKQILKEEITNATTSRPYLDEAARILHRLYQRLIQEGHDPRDAAWATNIAQHILLFLPLTGGDKKKALHLLTEGYNPEEYEAPLYILNAANLYTQLKQMKTKEEKLAALEEARNYVNATAETKTAIYRGLLSLKEEGRTEPPYMKAALENVMREVRVGRTRRPKPEK